ncbi:hypothetical protein K6V98_04890 [Collinsella sp. AGMB00827]|uniref:Uncharacterized protein n=1 Tax=Collinsella ureilytica TaxID=2869515 RepID=A0ABS7MKT5_9ACTN|nr:hypothetical protein [Collinsella urealyticum]MBY4797691.1 hypothetical protein [Collinsella urealyticum]
MTRQIQGHPYADELGAQVPTAGSYVDCGVDSQASKLPKKSDQKRTPVKQKKLVEPTDPYIRAEAEDDDGYDPYSDRRPEPEPLFEADPWR